MSKRVILFVLVGVMVLTTGWYFLAWSPENNTYGKDKTNLQTLQASHDSLASQVAGLKALQKNASATAKAAAFEKAIPPTSNLDTFIHQLQSAAAATGVTITTVSPALPDVPTGGVGETTPTTTAPSAAPSTGVPANADNAPVSEIKVSIGIIGSYQSTINFLNALSSMDRIVVTDSINMSATDSTKDSLQTQIAARIFTTQPPPVTITPGAAAPTTTVTTS